MLVGIVRHEDSLGKEPCGFLVTLEVRHVVEVCWKPLPEGSCSYGRLVCWGLGRRASRGTAGLSVMGDVVWLCMGVPYVEMGGK